MSDDIQKKTLTEMKNGVPLQAGVPAQFQVFSENVIRTRLNGFLFDTNKTFLLPGAITSIRAVREVFDKNPEGEILIVGHADTVGQNADNLKLSVERAKSIEAYFKNDVQVWLKNYTAPVASANWGIREDQMMLLRVSENGISFFRGDIDGNNNFEMQQAVKKFQQSRNLNPSGIMNQETREALIKAYMDEDGTSIPKERVTRIHGCGEEHPVEKTGDETEEEKNRRVEIFLFEKEIAPLPKACKSPGGCDEYAQWTEQVIETIVLDDGDPDELEDFRVKPRDLSRSNREEVLVTQKEEKKVATLTFLHLPLAAEQPLRTQA